GGKLVGDVAGERASLSLTPESYVGTVSDGMNLLRSVPLPPGTYQVRLAAREAGRSLLGSASQWVGIPDLGAQPLTPTRAFLPAHLPMKPRPDAKPGAEPERALTDAQVGKVFRPGQGLHYVVQLYTPAQAKTGPLTLQAQVWRGA